jgi:hypothetical protein
MNLLSGSAKVVAVLTAAGWTEVQGKREVNNEGDERWAISDDSFVEFKEESILAWRFNITN